MGDYQITKLILLLLLAICDVIMHACVTLYESIVDILSNSIHIFDHSIVYSEYIQYTREVIPRSGIWIVNYNYTL